MSANFLPVSFALVEDAIDVDLKCGITPLIFGDPGVGKSSFARDFGAKRGMNTYILNAVNYADRQDINGVKTVCVDDKNKEFAQKFFPTFVIQQAFKDAVEHPDKKVLLFIDEITRTATDVRSTLMQLETDKHIGDSDRPENLLIIIAANDRGDISPLDPAQMNRYSCYKIEPDIQTFFSVVPDLNHYIKAVLTKHPSYLYTDQDINTVSDQNSTDNDDDDDDIYNDNDLDMTDDMIQFTSPRSIEALSKKLNIAESEGMLSAWANTPIDNDGHTKLDMVISGTVGFTPLYLEVKMEILNGLINNVGNTTKTYLKPTSFDMCKAQTTKDDLVNLIKGFDGNTKCDLLIYALHDSDDNAVLITELAKCCTKTDFTAEKVSELTDLIKDKGANNYNLDILRNLDSSESYATLIVDINNL